MNPSTNGAIIRRELLGMLRTRKAMWFQWGTALCCTLLVALQWPSDSRIALSGAQAREMLIVFAYGVLAMLLFLVPAFPASSIIQERTRGTLVLLLNSPLRSVSIFLQKLIVVLAFSLLLLAMSLPAAAACYGLGGVSLTKDLAPLYLIFIMAILQTTTVALLVSSLVSSIDAAVRVAYGAVLGFAVLTLLPNQLFQGSDSLLAKGSHLLRGFSPIPAVMAILGHGDLAGTGLLNQQHPVFVYLMFAAATSLGCAVVTIVQLSPSMYDRPRPQGNVTELQSGGVRLLRRLVFLIDPQRRKSGIGPLTNPVMVKEFRTRRFGRMHWLMRLIAGCAMASLILTYSATVGSLGWGIDRVGALMVLLQVSLIVLVTPSLAAGLISGERESGGWTLLRMTPLSGPRILRGKLLSTLFTLGLVLFATMPGYLFVIYIKPILTTQVLRVIVCLLLSSAVALLISATVSSLCRRTAVATVWSYALLVGLCGIPMLVWLARDAPFGHTTVERTLSLNPIAASLNVMRMPGFIQYDLVPANWWIMGGLCILLTLILHIRTWHLTRAD